MLIIIYILDNPNMPKNFLHPEENRLFSKGNTQSPEYLGGTSLRSNNRNVNNEFLNGNINYNNSSNNNINNMSYNTNFNTYSNNNNIKPYSNYNKLGSNVPFQRNQISMDYPRQTPANKIFGSIFLNDYSNQSNNNSEFYSKRKLQMIKDYNETLNKKDESEFKSQELQKRSMEQGVNTQRIDNIERSISPTSSRFYEYNKKFDHKTVFDDKKILYNKAYYGNYYPPKINNQNIVNY